MERCPVCRARVKEKKPVCRRCRSDLSLLFEIEEQAAALVELAARALTDGSRSKAAALAAKSLVLQDTLFARTLCRFIESDYRHPI